MLRQLPLAAELMRMRHLPLHAKRPGLDMPACTSTHKVKDGLVRSQRKAGGSARPMVCDCMPENVCAARACLGIALRVAEALRIPPKGTGGDPAGTCGCSMMLLWRWRRGPLRATQ